MISSLQKGSMVAKGWMKKMDRIVYYNRQPSIAIETGTNRNEIDRVKHHRAGAARADNGLVVYRKVGKIAQMC